jgi:hypothetical protein
VSRSEGTLLDGSKCLFIGFQALADREKRVIQSQIKGVQRQKTGRMLLPVFCDRFQVAIGVLYD